MQKELRTKNDKCENGETVPDSVVFCVMYMQFVVIV